MEFTPPRHALELIGELQPLKWEGEVFRILPSLAHPLAPTTEAARWNPRGVSTIYTSLEADTAHAEARHRLTEVAARRLRQHLRHRIVATLPRVLDLRDNDVLKRIGAIVGAIDESTAVASRVIGGAAAWLEHDGLLVPSYRRPGTNLVIFLDVVEAGAGSIEVTESTVEDLSDV